MREIKFRAWDKVKKRFYDDVFCVYDDGSVGAELCFGDRVMTTTGNLVLMQYTGLKDKNRKEIYEDDLVIWYGQRCKVEKRGLAFCFVGLEPFFNKHTRESLDTITADTPKNHELVCAEVIGNIYENKDLLDDKQADKIALDK